MYLTIAFYQFITLDNKNSIQEKIQIFCGVNNIKGTILLADEGINGTISGRENNIRNFLQFVKKESFLSGIFSQLEHKESWATKNPFYRMKVRLKKEIVALGVAGVSPTVKVGKYVKPEDWNNLISDPNTIIIDTRNNYEVDIGTFKNAINPNTATFRELPNYVENNLNPKTRKKIAMFCTGGIRCEKATSLMIEKGFQDVYHLKGGILKYLETIDKDKSLWKGECFVFDERVAVTHGLNEGKYDQCYACRHPLSPDEMNSSYYIKYVSCPYCFNKLTDKKKSSVIERKKQIELAKLRGEVHIGKHLNRNENE
jgi:UPF0176 protein